MANFSLRRFTNPEILKSINRDSLLSLLSRHKDYFARRHVLLPAVGVVLHVAEATASYGGAARKVEVEPTELDYEGIARVLMTPDETTPRELVDDLFFVDEMATNEAMDELLDEITRLPPIQRKQLNFGSDPTPADVAVQIRLKAPDLLERKHAEHFLTSKRSFEYFQAKKGADRTFRMPTAKALASLEGALDDRFDEMKRGRNCKVFVYQKDDCVWFLVRHGDPCKREGAIEAGGSSSVYYRPERYDVLKYDGNLGELCLNAENKKISELYREKFGLHFFADATHFPGTAKYTLEPLRVDGAASLVCSDVEGIEWIRLKEIQYFWGGPEGEIEVRKASNLFAVLERRERSIPAKVRIMRAGFLAKFSDSKTPRTVTIHPSNVASYTRDSDASAVEDWLTKRGFVVADSDADA